MLESRHGRERGSMIVGERIRRPDAPDKVKGSALYIEDLAFIGALWGAVLRSPHAHARIARLDVTRARSVAGVPDGQGGVVVYGSMQCPFYVQKAVASALGCDLAQARIVQTVTGGGFGGKEDAPSAPGAQVALLARATGRPVRLILSREEDMAVMSKRHPGRVRMRTAATPDGRLVAAEVDYLLDGGAYATLSPVVLFRGTVHACGPYRIPNVKVDSRVVRTHKVPCGAFRGFGEPQVVFACESQMDRLAERLGMDPLMLRLKNALGEGDETITGHKL